MLFAQFADTIKKLESLLDLTLCYPVNAMTLACKKLAMPKAAAMEAIEMFRVQKPNGRFVWMIFDAIVIYKSATKDILICVRENIWERQENLYTLLPQFLADLNPDRLPPSPADEESAIWRAVCAP